MTPSLLKRFDEKFGGTVHFSPDHKYEIREFLRTALTELKEEMASEKYKDVRDTSNNVADDPDYEAEHQQSYNAAIDICIAILDKALAE